MAVGDDEVNIIPASGNMIIDDRLFALGSLERLTGLLHEFRMDPVVAGVAPTSALMMLMVIFSLAISSLLSRATHLT